MKKTYNNGKTIITLEQNEIMMIEFENSNGVKEKRNLGFFLSAEFPRNAMRIPAYLLLAVFDFTHAYVMNKSDEIELYKNTKEQIKYLQEKEQTLLRIL